MRSSIKRTLNTYQPIFKLTPKTIIPDVSINCNTRDRKNVSLTGIPRMIMEVLSNATEEYDRGEKMEVYRKVGVSEYWIVDWEKGG